MKASIIIIASLLLLPSFTREISKKITDIKKIYLSNQFGYNL
jgi:hypothetical protein